MERVTPYAVFSRVGVEYAGHIVIKHGHTRKPLVIKACVCVFVSTVKAEHFASVSDVGSMFKTQLLQLLHKPSLIRSDHRM